MEPVGELGQYRRRWRSRAELRLAIVFWTDGKQDGDGQATENDHDWSLGCLRDLVTLWRVDLAPRSGFSPSGCGVTSLRGGKTLTQPERVRSRSSGMCQHLS
jgi:hypothetical protein